MSDSRIIQRIALLILSGTFLLTQPAKHTWGSQQSTPDLPFLAPFEQAKRLAWIGNWDEAAPLFGRALKDSQVRKDHTRELYAKIGLIRATMEGQPYEKASAELGALLLDPAMRDFNLRLWCLAAKGYADLNVNIRAAKASWTEVLRLASHLNDASWQTRATGELGIIDFLNGDRSHAVWRIGKAIWSAEAHKDTDAYVRYLSMLGDGFVEEQRYWMALPILRHAIKVSESVPDAGFPFLAYQGAAAALMGQGDYEQARSLLGVSLTKARERQRKGQEGLTFLLLGNCAHRVGKESEAVEDWTKAISILGEIKAYRPLAQAWFNLGNLQRDSGSLDEAKKSLLNGVHASRHTGDRIYYPRDLTALAQVYLLRGEDNQADLEYRAAERAFEALALNENSSFGASGFAAARSRTYLEHFDLQLRHGNNSGALLTIERVRAITAIERQRKLRYNPNDESLSKSENAVSALQLALLQSEDAHQRSILLDQLTEQERKLAFDENAMNLQTERPRLRPLTEGNIRASIGANEVVLEYVLESQKTFCIVISRAGLQIVDLKVQPNRIKQLVKLATDDINQHGFAYASTRELYQLLLMPLILPAGSNLVIIPDGPLHRLPFEILRTESDKYLLETHTVSYASSATELWLLRTGKRDSVDKPLLAVGGVNYGSIHISNRRAEVRNAGLGAWIERGVSELTGNYLPDLPHSAEEVTTIGSIAGGSAVILSGESATEASFKRQPLETFRVIHFAVHAVSDTHYPERAALILGTTGGNSEDGLLQAREIVRLHLAADLVTLSGCDTLIGTSRDQAGVESLEQAFMLAGARSVVGSLWQVQDQSTELLMQFFYAHLAQKEEKAVALAHAKRDFIERVGNPSPYYWAGFVLVGDGSGSVGW